MADSPVAEYQVKESNGKFKIVGEIYGAAPYGIAMGKDTGMSRRSARMERVIVGARTRRSSKVGRRAGGDREPVVNGGDELAGRSHADRSGSPAAKPEEIRPSRSATRAVGRRRIVVMLAASRSTRRRRTRGSGGARSASTCSPIGSCTASC